MEEYSVLMTVYYKEKPENLHESIQSMLGQTVPTNDFVLVCDGPLTPELDTVIDNFRLKSDQFNVVRLEYNVGVGKAANEGLKHCKNELIAKMDSDDISRSDRCEKQLMLFASDPSLDIVSSHIIEFIDNVNNEVSRRIVPLGHADIMKYARRRMPFNNPTVMYRKSKVLDVGGYSELRRCEDYDLFVRMLENGSNARNINDYLLWYRISKDNIHRRGTWDQLKGFTIVRWRMLMRGFSGLLDFLIPCFAQLILTLAPRKLKEYLYRKSLRKKPN